jgi:ABC-type hemin transport system ATPase subunit
MLKAERVSFRYRASDPLVVDDVSLAIEPGEMVGILGPNGSGKTTLLKMLSGTLTPSAGTIQFDGRPLGEWKRRDLARRIALVPQETHAPFDFTVLDIVLMGCDAHMSDSRQSGVGLRAIRGINLRTGFGEFHDSAPCIAGKLAAAMDWPTRRLDSSGKARKILPDKSSNSRRKTSRAF